MEQLVTEKVTVHDNAKRKVKKMTAFQTALCAMDDELCAMLAKYMKKEEMRYQYICIFLIGHEYHYEYQTPFDFSQVINAIAQTTNAEIEKALSLELPNDTVLWEQLTQFRAKFTQRSCQQEWVFNPKHLIQAFKHYESNFKYWNLNQSNLFWRQVIGYVYRFLPANIAMDVAQGLYYRVENKEPGKRSLNFRFGGEAIF